MRETGQLALGVVGMTTGAIAAWLIYKVPTATGVPDETSPEAAWLVCGPALVGAAVVFILSLGSVLSQRRRERLLGVAGIAAALTLAWAMMAVIFFGALLLLLLSADNR